ncbi:MAG: hypothetical protein ABSB01_15340 [Streptosporangiaceae bacterium]|jgi:hypothetical protein
MSAFQQLTRSEKIAGAAGIVLLIGMIAFPWYHVGVPGYTIAGQTYGGGSYDGNALSGPGSFFSVVALIVLIALLAEIAISRFTATQLPDLPVSWSAAKLYAGIGVLALLVIKILFHVGNFGWGFYTDLAAAAVLVYGAVAMSRAPAPQRAQVAGPRHSSIQ